MRACKSTNIMYAYVEQVNQHHADQIDLTMSPLQFLMDKFPGDSSYDHEQAPPVHCVWYTACVRRIVCCMCSARTLHLRGMCACGMCSGHTPHTLPNREQALRSHLHSCGVTSEMQLLPSSALSGGQRSRVALAAVSYTAPHVLVLAGGVEGGRGGRVEGGRGGGSDDPTILPSYPPPTTHLPSIHSPPHAPSPLLSPPPPTIQVLDEPTNNLDLESVASLADCIESFKGGVVLVSHDQYFVGRVAREVWVVDQGTVKKASSFDAYRAAQLAKLK